MHPNKYKRLNLAAKVGPEMDKSGSSLESAIRDNVRCLRCLLSKKLESYLRIRKLGKSIRLPWYNSSFEIECMRLSERKVEARAINRSTGSTTLARLRVHMRSSRKFAIVSSNSKSWGTTSKVIDWRSSRNWWVEQGGSCAKWSRIQVRQRHGVEGYCSAICKNLFNAATLSSLLWPLSKRCAGPRQVLQTRLALWSKLTCQTAAANSLG